MEDYVSEKIKYFKTSEPIIGRPTTQEIFHYTSAESLISIIEKKSIRFTDCQFVNDKTEYNHILVFYEKAYSRVFNELKNSSIFKNITDHINKNYEYNQVKLEHNKSFTFTLVKKRYYIFCSTLEKDSLNMWNYYAKNGNYEGYNIRVGINEVLTCLRLLNNSNIDAIYGKVIYEDEIKIKELCEIMKALDNKFSKELDNNISYEEKDELETNIIGQMINYIESYRLLFKDSAFKDEKEYRFVIRIPTDYVAEANDVLKIKYDIKKGIVTPHCLLNFEKNNIISGITISPTLDDKLAKNGLERLLMANKIYKDVVIEQSGIPIRY